MIPDQGEMPEQSPDMGKNNFQGVIELQAFDSIDAVVGYTGSDTAFGNRTDPYRH